jgi:hypothetical protein
MSRPINIVYFGFININRNWQVIINGQLDDLISSGILSRATLYIQMVCEGDNEKLELESIIHSKLSGMEYHLDIKRKNRYEYDGIKKLYDLALVEPDKLYLYFHTKGMMYLHNNRESFNERSKQETFLTRKTLEKWEFIVNLYETDKDVDKMALFPSCGRELNICWYNFFWVRGDFLNTREEPRITDDRFYYELWIRSGNINGNTFNIMEENFATYTSDEAVYLSNMN